MLLDSGRYLNLLTPCETTLLGNKSLSLLLPAGERNPGSLFSCYWNPILGSLLKLDRSESQISTSPPVRHFWLQILLSFWPPSDRGYGSGVVSDFAYSWVVVRALDFH